MRSLRYLNGRTLSPFPAEAEHTERARELAREALGAGTAMDYPALTRDVERALLRFGALCIEETAGISPKQARQLAKELVNEPSR